MKPWHLAILIFCIGILAYFPSFFGRFVWDDEDFVYKNTYVQNFQWQQLWTEQAVAGRGKQSNYYRPLQFTLYATVHSLFGFQPFAYHALNIFVHALAGVCVFAFFYSLIGSTIPAAIIAILFLIHPVQTEAVSYISGLSDPLFVLFGMASAWCFLQVNPPKPYFLITSIICFILAMLSKETGIVFVGLITLLWIVKKPHKQSWYILIPYISAAMLYLAWHTTRIQTVNMQAIWGDTPYAHNVLIRLATYIQNLQTYISILIFPQHLFMERDETIHIASSLFTIQTGIVVGLLGSIGILFVKVKTQRNLLFFCFLGFFTSFLPYSGLVLINGIFYEHFLYLPLVFFFAALILLIEKLLKKPVVLGCIAIVLLLFISRSYVRQDEWIEPIRLYTQTLHYAPQSIRVINNLGMAYAQQHRLDEAIETYEKGIVLNQRVPNLYHNLSNAYQEKGDMKQAELLLLKAIEVDPNFAFSYGALVQMYQKQNRKTDMEHMITRYEKQFQVKVGR